MYTCPGSWKLFYPCSSACTVHVQYKLLPSLEALLCSVMLCEKCALQVKLLFRRGTAQRSAHRTAQVYRSGVACRREWDAANETQCW
jgi:hypothetical protein